MDRFHRDSRGQDTRNGRVCQFCSRMDPEFASRKPVDRLVQTQLDDIASAHLTEDGYVRHRIAELTKMRAFHVQGEGLQKSA